METSTSKKLPLFIGLNGKIGAGKDTVAGYLVQEYGFIKLGFADSLKEVCAALYGQKLEDFYNSIKKEEYIPFWEMTRREMLQFIGTEIVRDHVHKEHWIKLIKYKIIQHWAPNICERFVFTDTRFQNEIDFICQRENGVVIEIMRAKNPLLSLVKNKEHASEMQKLHIPDAKHYHLSNHSTKEDLYEQLEAMCILAFKLN